jgi:hypothetical protein
MRPWLALAALGVALVASPMLAQRRGGGSVGVAGRGGFGGHSAVFAGRPASVARGFGPGVMRPGVRWGINSGWWVHSSFSHNQFFFHDRFHRGFGRWWWYPWYPWWGWYGGPDWDNDYPNMRQPTYPINAYGYQDNSAYGASYSQQAEIDRLNAEVERLNNERDRSVATSESSRPQPESPSTKLIFRDKHTEQIQNYAIAGNVLYDLTGGHRRRIPLADLDLPATTRANEESGLDFQIPNGEGN